MDGRDQILQALSASMKQGCVLPKDTIGWKRPKWSKAELWQIFEERLSAVGGKMASLDGLNELVHGEVLLEEGLPESVIKLVRSTTSDPWIADLAITTAKVAIAESGTVLVDTGPAKPRLSSLAPPRHIVLIDPENIVDRLDDAMPFISNRTSVFITGPSRTADIEGALVHGVHGPKEFTVVKLD